MGRVHEWKAAVQTSLDHPFRRSAGVLGLVLGIGLYAGAADALWRARASPALWLLGPAVAAFLVANLVDWPWHLAGLGAAWALAAGGLVAAAQSST